MVDLYDAYGTDVGRSRSIDVLALQLTRRGRCAEAEQLFRAAQDAGVLWNWYELPNVLIRIGKYEEAEQIIRRRVASGDAMALIRLANLLLLGGHTGHGDEVAPAVAGCSRHLARIGSDSTARCRPTRPGGADASPTGKITPDTVRLAGPGAKTRLGHTLPKLRVAALPQSEADDAHDQGNPDRTVHMGGSADASRRTVWDRRSGPEGSAQSRR